MSFTYQLPNATCPTCKGTSGTLGDINHTHDCTGPKHPNLANSRAYNKGYYHHDRNPSSRIDILMQMPSLGGLEHRFGQMSLNGPKGGRKNRKPTKKNRHRRRNRRSSKKNRRN